MVILVQSVIALIICTVVPLVIGDLVLPDSSFCNRYILGIFSTLAVAQVLYLPFIYYQHSYTVYFWIYVVLVSGLCVFSVIKNHSHYKKDLTSILSLNKFKENLCIWSIVALIIIGIQVLRVAFGHFFVYADNATYIPIINDILETDLDAYLYFKTGEPGFREGNIKYLFTTYFPYLATICKISGVHPAILVQTILPVILTIVSYALVWQYGFLLFKEKKSSWVFVFFFSVLVETIGGYDYTYANHVISGIYFGKKIVFTILLPYILLFIAERTSLLEDKTVVLSKADVIRVFIMMVGICAPSLMGTGLAPIVLFCMGIVLMIRKKSLVPMLQMVISMVPTIVMLLMVVHYLYFKK